MTRSLLAAACIIAAAGPSATGASAATVDAISYGGHRPAAIFETVDGCLQRSAFVLADEGISQQGHAGRTRQPDALVSIAQTNTCTGASHLVYGHADLAPGDLTVRGDLGFATLHGTVLVRQPFQDAPTVQVTFDLEWQAAGDVLRDTWNGTSRWDHNLDLGRELLWYRPAVATGSISSGGIDYTGATPSRSAAIWFSKVGDIAITH